MLPYRYLHILKKFKVQIWPGISFSASFSNNNQLICYFLSVNTLNFRVFFRSCPISLSSVYLSNNITLEYTVDTTSVCKSKYISHESCNTPLFHTYRYIYLCVWNKLMCLELYQIDWVISKRSYVYILFLLMYKCYIYIYIIKDLYLFLLV